MPEPAAVPAACEVIVIGAGPAGSACAQALATAGIDVLLVDQHVFPRDKVCGDGLIPDALAALRRLGVFDEVMASAVQVPFVRCVAPRGGQVDVPGTLAVLPRRQLDLILLNAALRAGARACMPARFEVPLLNGERVVGARLTVGDQVHEVRARWVVIATGAVPQALIAAGLCERRTPSGVALRGYVHHPAMVGRITGLEIVWHPRLAGGYGWIFPAPGGVFNIGAGLTGSHQVEGQEGRLKKKRDVNLRKMFDDFCEVYAPARELMAGGTLQGELRGELKGAPLRCSLNGARWSRPGLLVAGEAAGSTYSFSGEGIGKAMETGLLAAEALIADQTSTDADTRARYELSLRALKPRFDLYDKAAIVNQHPWLADLVIWRARRSPRILRRMVGVLEETQNPGRLMTFSGIRKLLTE